MEFVDLPNSSNVFRSIFTTNTDWKHPFENDYFKIPDFFSVSNLQGTMQLATLHKKRDLEFLIVLCALMINYKKP